MKNICVFLYSEPHTHISMINSKVQENDMQSINVMILTLCTLYSYNINTDIGYNVISWEKMLLL